MKDQDFEQQIDALYNDNRNVKHYKEEAKALEVVQYIEKRIGELKQVVFRENSDNWESDKSNLTPTRTQKINNDINEILENNKYSKYHQYKKVKEILTAKFKELSDENKKTIENSPKKKRNRKPNPKFAEIDKLIWEKYENFKGLTLKKQTKSEFAEYLKTKIEDDYFESSPRKTIESRIDKAGIKFT